MGITSATAASRSTPKPFQLSGRSYTELWLLNFFGKEVSTTTIGDWRRLVHPSTTDAKARAAMAAGLGLVRQRLEDFGYTHVGVKLGDFTSPISIEAEWHGRGAPPNPFPSSERAKLIAKLAKLRH